MKKLIEYFIKYPVGGNILIFLIIILGYFGFTNLRSTLMPQVDPGYIIITAAYPGASPQEIEQGIILKIENNLQGISGVRKISSSSRENSGTVNVEVISGFDTDIVLQDIKNAVDGISSFPSGMEPPNVKKWEFRDRAVEFMLSGPVDLATLKDKAREVENELLQMDGISKLSISGYPDEEIEIAFREADLRAYGITITEAVTAVKSANIDVTGGTIRGDDEELYIRALQKKYYADELQDIVLRSSSDGAILRLRDVADITEKWSEEPNRVYVDGDPAVLFTANYTSDEDIIDLAEKVVAYVDTFNKKNSIISASIINNEALGIRSMQQTLLQNGSLGFMLVIVFLSIFLNARLSFWVAISIPLSFMGMFALAAAYGITLNRISLFGMILIIGILVDDGIVIGENIFQHYERGKKPVRAAIDGALEVLPAVFSAVLTTIIAFSAILFIEGMFGQMFRELAFVVIAALTVSLVEGALILPAHIAHSKALDRNRKISKVEKYIGVLTAKLRENIYAPILRAALRNKLVTIVAVTAVFIVTIIGGFGSGVIRMGDAGSRNESSATISLEMPAGTPEGITFAYLNQVETAARTVADRFNTDAGHTVVTNIVKQLSSASTGEITLYLVDTKYRDFVSSDILNAIRPEVGSIPAAERINYQETGRFGRPVSISILSNNLEDVNGAVADLKTELEQFSGLKNVLDNNQVGMREVHITLKEKAYLLGLTYQDVIGQIRNGFFGSEVQRINRGLDEVKIWVRYQRADRSSITNLENLRITTTTGQSIPLKELADLSFDRSLTVISHLNGQREVTVEADAANSDVDISVIKDEINLSILPKIKSKYPSIQIYFGGRDEHMKELMKSVIKIVPSMLVILFTVIAFTFRSFTQTILIIALIPLGIVGIGWGHWLHGKAIDMPSYFGVITLLGIMVNDSIVLINTLNLRLRQGTKFMPAVYEAGISRFRPILLTSLTTMVGLYPLILSKDPGNFFTIPMAISVTYGVLVSTLITLIVLPVMLVIINSATRRLVRLRTGTMPSREEVERAVREMQVEQLM